MPSYNYSQYIPEAIDSVVRQTYPNWELLVVDDGSTDDSVKNIRDYSDRHSTKIQLLTHPGHAHRGLVETYALGLKKATGDYIAFLEADDAWHKDSLRIRAAALDKHSEASLVFTNVELFGARSSWMTSVRQLTDILRQENRVRRYRSFEGSDILRRNYIYSFSVAMVRRENFQNLDWGVPEECGRWLDWWLWAQLSLRGKFFYIPKKLTQWRVHEMSYNCQLNQPLSGQRERARSFLLAMNRVHEHRRRVAIVVPLRGSELNPTERSALSHLQIRLAHYEKFLALPENLPFSHSGFSIQRFSPHFLGGNKTGNHLLQRKMFYERFCGFEYLLTCPLDNPIYLDDLMKWLKGKYFFEPSEKNYASNGGFSWRRIGSSVQPFVLPLKTRKSFRAKLLKLKERFLFRYRNQGLLVTFLIGARLLLRNTFQIFLSRNRAVQIR